MRSFLSIRLIALTTILFSSARSQTESQTTVGGYGELHYNEPDGIRRGVLDFHRFVLFVNHNFNSKISFRSEIEIEHTKIEAGSADGGEVAIEQAYLDYALQPNFGIRAGIVLPPVGLINLYHEPPIFHGVERPNVERVIIPATWRESGLGVYGTISEALRYQAYLVAGLKAEGFTAGNGIRGGRQEALESSPANPSLTGRLDYSPMLGLQLGGSFFIGGSSADVDSIGNATVALWCADARYSYENLSLKALGVVASISDADKINRAFGNSVADRVYGFYVEGAYNILPFLAPESEEELHVFARYEKYNTQASTSGFLALPQYNRNDIVVGVTYKPTYNTAFKFDYTFLNNKLNTGSNTNTQQLNLGIGYFFN
jgi:hypothetical protein